MDHTDCKTTQPSDSDLEAPPQASTAPSPENFEAKKERFGPRSEDPDQKSNVSGFIVGSEAKATSPGLECLKAGESVKETSYAVSVDGTPTHSVGSAPYASHSLSSSTVSFKEKMESVRSMLGRWGVGVMYAAKKAEVLAGSTWQHLKTSPSFADAAMGRIAHGTKVLAEGGYENIFRQTFETAADEMLKTSYACYLSTSAGPVMGSLYVSTAKLAFCSDTALPYNDGDKTEWSYYKLIIPLHELKAVYPSSSKTNPAEKFIQVISIDNHEFWFMGFLNYEGAVTSLQEALQAETLQSV